MMGGLTEDSIGRWTEVFCFQKEIDLRGCSDLALGLHTCILPLYSNKFIGIYLGFQVSVYRTNGPLVNIYQQDKLQTSVIKTFSFNLFGLFSYL